MRFADAFPAYLVLMLGLFQVAAAAAAARSGAPRSMMISAGRRIGARQSMMISVGRRTGARQSMMISVGRRARWFLLVVVYRSGIWR
ncbi:hypothetical protein DFH09DRAFT_1328090 [Mycena vulgaris]|nr:hypothetical protein DFH09DRAFT_1328090 [Mycena vulgaris]